MALTFGKGNRSIAFNPTSAFPLDARSYFESYEAALAAAQSAKEAGSVDSIYYFGQEIAVVENGNATLYIIQPDNSLKEVGKDLIIDTNIFNFKTDVGSLTLNGFDSASAGAQLTKQADGTINWVLPDNSIAQSAKSLVDELNEQLATNYYTSEQTDLAISQAITNANHLSRKILNTYSELENYIATTDDDIYQYIYMIPSGLTADDNKYYEYIVLQHKVVNEETGEIVIEPKIEKVGSWEVDLSNYVTTDQWNNKVDAVEGHSLIPVSTLSALGELLEQEPEHNFINDIDTTQFEIDDKNRQLKLVAVSPEIITDFAKIMDGKVSVEEGKGLSSNDFTDELKQQLESINVQELQSTISQVGNLSNYVLGYTDSENNHVKGFAETVPELQTVVNTLSGKIDTANGNITTINNLLNGYTKDDNTKETGLIERVTSLESITSELNDTYVSIGDFNNIVGDMKALAGNTRNITERIDDLKDELDTRLTWGEIPELIEN